MSYSKYIIIILTLLLAVGSSVADADDFPPDVSKIQTLMISTSHHWNEIGVRTQFGPWNNFLRFLGDVSANRIGNSQFLGCYEQAHSLISVFESQTTLVGWKFEERGNGFHHWVVAQSMESGRGSIIIDPWKGVIMRAGKR